MPPERLGVLDLAYDWRFSPAGHALRAAAEYALQSSRLATLRLGKGGDFRGLPDRYPISSVDSDRWITDGGRPPDTS